MDQKFWLSAMDNAADTQNPNAVSAWDEAPTGPVGSLLQVDVRLNLYKVSAVDSRAGTFNVKLGVFCYWSDPRLVGWKGQLPEDLWGPRFRVANATPDLSETNVEFAIVDHSKGRLKRCRIYAGLVESPLTDLKSFPFDINTFGVKLCTISDFSSFDDSLKGTVAVGKSYCVREICEPGEGDWLAVLWDSSVLEWRLHGVSTSIDALPPHPTAGYEQTYLYVKMHMSRRSNYFVWKVLLPLFTMMSLAMTAFGMDPTDVPSRSSLVSTYFLATFAMLFVVGDSLPKLDFLTSVDVVITMSSGLLLFIGVAALPIAWLAKSDPELGEQVNLTCGCAVYALYVATYVYAFVPAMLRKAHIVRELGEVGGGEQVKGGSKYHICQDKEHSSSLSAQPKRRSARLPSVRL